MAVITIDGTRLEVPENKNVLECALEAGIYIPHLCHHPDLPENGSCRMCIVEVEGQEGLLDLGLRRAMGGRQVGVDGPLDDKWGREKGDVTHRRPRPARGRFRRGGLAARRSGPRRKRCNSSPPSGSPNTSTHP